MRNLKKILALVLALVMSFSLMATANAFTDDEKITDTYETAVTVLSGLKVFQGYDDGTFQPQGPITRAEVAAIIYRIVTGDVADTQVGIYADYNKFDDVKSTSWYAGYVNFCANAEYIKGYDAKTFGPNDPVTGYQALAMILRALGYDKNGEFTGASWQVQTAAVGENRGITKNISAGTLGTAATREVVAEILFRAILVEKVNYTPAFGYQLDDTSIGWDTFELEEITGVVVANEYADLYDTEALKAGKTELDVDGESYMLDYTTTLTDIGEARSAYITEGKNVLAIGDAGNTVFETGAATDISTDKKFESASALERDDETEYFLNFDGGNTYKASDWRIKFVLDFETSAAVDKFEQEYDVDLVKVMDNAKTSDTTFTKVIRAGSEITSDDLAIIKAIFNDADLVNDGTDDDIVVGEVYVGTQSTTDISDELSYNQFKDKYIETSENGRDVEDTDNGEWLKIIDNDGDGVADVVLKTEFAMSVIERISKSDEYTLADLEQKADAVEFKDTVKIDGDDIVTEDELAADDVVIYTLIDGKYYMNIAEMVTETVDKKGINSKTETMTCGGTDYVQSHIGYTDETPYLYDVTDAHTEETYDLYLDHFGFVRLFIESEYNTFMLLTDGWYENDRRDETFKAMYWDVEGAEEQEINVADAGDVEKFISVGAWGDQETWGRLYGADDTYSLRDNFITNIAGYSSADDSYTLKTVGHSTSREQYDVQNLKVDSKTDLDDELLYNVNDGRVQTTTKTQYYLVVRDYDRYNRAVVGDILTWTGYKNVPENAEMGAWTVAYAVTHEAVNNAAYDVADVVVFETNDAHDHNTYFVYEHNNYNIEHVWGLGYNENDEIEDQQIDVEASSDLFNNVPNGGKIWFYEIYDNEAVFPIMKDYAKYNIYAGNVDVEYDVFGNDYIQVAVDNVTKGYLRFNPENIPIYQVTKDGDYSLDKVDNWDEITSGDAMILYTDDDNNVEYAIFVELDRDESDYLVVAETLWWYIWNDAHYVDYNLTVKNLVDNAGYELTFDATEGYIIASDGDDNYTVIDGEYTLSLSAKPGYVLSSDIYVTVNNVSVPANSDGTYTIVVNGKDVVVEINSKTSADDYTITYVVDATKGEAKAADTFYVTDLPYALTDATAKTGWKFVGWQNADGEMVTEITEIGDVTLTAVFEQVDYTLTVEYYDADGQYDRTTNTTKQEGTEITLKLDGPSAYSYDNKDFTVVKDYTDGITLTLTKDTTVYVKALAEVDYTVQNNAGNYTCEPMSGTVDVDDTTLQLTLTKNSGGNFTKSDTLVLTYEVNGVQDTAEVAVTNSVNSATFTIDLGTIVGPLTITIVGDLTWK